MIQSFALRSALVIAAVAAGAAVADVRAADQPDDYKSLLAGRRAVLQALIEPAAACVRRRDTRHAAFRGCIDWHSAVHGTWALVFYTRVTRDRKYVPLIAARLRPRNLAIERALLRRRPNFEMPYGRAWFLRLAIEHERTFRSTKLGAMADDVASSLIAHYRSRSPDPMGRNYENASWALIQLWHFGRHRRSREITGFVERMVRRHYLRPPGACPVHVERRSWPDFTSVCGNWAYLVSLVLDRRSMRAWTVRFLPRPSRLRPIERPRSAHHHGMNFSRAWGYWRIYKATGDRRFRRLYADHFTLQYGKRAWWAGNYRAVGHWVAQFGVYAIAPLFDEK